jgi:hypothetical protein
MTPDTILMQTILKQNAIKYNTHCKKVHTQRMTLRGPHQFNFVLGIHVYNRIQKLLQVTIALPKVHSRTSDIDDKPLASISVMQDVTITGTGQPSILLQQLIH